MKTITAVLLASAATFGLAGAALAADPILPPPADIYIPEVGGVDWSGFYVGANVGYGWGTVENDIGGGGDFENDFEYDLDGFVGGVQAGANVQFDSFVAGIEGDIAWSGAEGSIDIGPEITGNVNWIGTVRGRLGFAAENFLIYGTAGVAFADTTAEWSGEGDDDGSHTGWVAGVGAEVLVTDNLSVKAEYLYHSFGEERYFDAADARFDLQTVKVGLNFHF